MNTYELKEYIIENDKTKDVLESIGCLKIKTYSKEYRCGSEKHRNSTSVSVRKKDLKVKIYGKDDKINGDIITLTMILKNQPFPQAVEEIHKILGIKYTGMTRKVSKDDYGIDILRVFKKVLKSNIDYNSEELNILDEDISQEYVKCPYIEWIREGILPHTQEVFGVGYSAKSNRVVIPHRYWSGGINDYVGVIGRTLVKNYEMFDIPKYFPLHKFPKKMNLFGLQENYEGIQKEGYVRVYESEKSPMKRHSKLDYTGTAICGNELSDEQAKIIIGLNVDVEILLDEGISEEHIWGICDKFYGIRTVYYVYDRLGLLSKKESPADSHEKVFKALINRKIKYTEEHHNKYLKYLEEKEKRD